MSNIPRGWTVERLNRARELYIDEGRSSTETARILGGTTRNAVIGIAHRKGWIKVARQRPSKPTTERVVRTPKAIARPPKTPPSKVAHGEATAGATDAQRQAYAVKGRAVVDRFAAANDDAIPLMERVFGQCAWPVGIPDRPEGQLCCGAEASEGKPYCAAHCSVGFVAFTKKTAPRELARSLRRFI